MNPATVHRVLDGTQAAALLGALVPGELRLELESVWAKPGRHFNVCYRDEGAGLLSLCVVSREAGAKALRLAGKHRAARERGRVAAMVSEDVLAQIFPFDYRLPRLSECLDLRTVHTSAGEQAFVHGEVVAYRAGMRCLLRYRDPAGVRAYGKLAADREPGRRARVQRALSVATAATTMRVPALLASVEPIGLDLVEAAAGQSLHDVLAAAPSAEPVVATMRALAELHATQEGPADRVHSCTEELALLGSWIGWMRELDRELAALLDATMRELEQSAASTNPRGFAHRDFHDKQVLLDGARLWLLDVDTACAGDPELDLGNFLAHLFLRGQQRARPAIHLELEVEAEQAYGEGARRERTRWYRRASLARLACVYRLRPRWQHLSPVLAEEARTS